MMAYSIYFTHYKGLLKMISTFRYARVSATLPWLTVALSMAALGNYWTNSYWVIINIWYICTPCECSHSSLDSYFEKFRHSSIDSHFEKFRVQLPEKPKGFLDFEQPLFVLYFQNRNQEKYPCTFQNVAVVATQSWTVSFWLQLYVPSWPWEYSSFQPTFGIEKDLRKNCTTN